MKRRPQAERHAAILKLRRLGRKPRDIAAEFGIKSKTVTNICRIEAARQERQVWRDEAMQRKRAREMAWPFSDWPPE